MSTTTRKLQAEHWVEYFDAIRLDNCPVLASVQVMGEQPSTGNGLPRRLHAIGYDSRRDLLEVAVGFSRSGEAPLHYFIASPRNVDVAEWDGTRTILVEDASGAQTLISLFNVGPVNATSTSPASRAAPPASHNSQPERF